MITLTSRILAGTFVTAAALSASWAAKTSAEETVLLRYKFQPGQVVRYSVKAEDETIIQSGEVKETLKSSQSSIKSYRVLSVDEAGAALLELTLIEEVRAEIDQDGQKLIYDSSAPEGPVPPVFIDMKEMVGKPHMRIAATPIGEITGAFVLLGKLSESHEKTGEDPTDGKEANSNSVSEAENKLRLAAMDVFLQLPEGPVAVGAGWTEIFHVPVKISEELSLKKDVRMLRQYKLRCVQDGLATIDIVTKVLTPVYVPEQQVQLIRRTPQETVTIDLQRGLIVEKTLTLENDVVGFSQGQAAMTTRQNHTERLIEPEQLGSRGPAVGQTE